MGLKTTTLISMFRNVSMIPEAVVHSYVLSHCSSVSIRTSHFEYVGTKTYPSELGSIFVFFATRSSRGAPSFMTVTYCVLYFCPSKMFLMVRIGTGLEV